MYSLHGNNLVIDNQNKKYVLKIRELPENEKPREKLLECGPEALSAPELLAVVLNVGTKKEEIMAMASRVVKEYGEKSVASQTCAKTMSDDLGIPLIKACQIVACFELGRRFFTDSRNGPVVIRTAKQAFEYLKDMRDLPKEQLRGIYLNSRHRVIHDEVISVGSLTANIVHPREVFRPALMYSAVAVIVAHNHPSGSIKPTKSDLEITEQLVAAGKILGVDLIDHIIIAGNKFASVQVDYS